MDNGRFGGVGAAVFSVLLVSSLLAATGVGAAATVSPIPGAESPLNDDERFEGGFEAGSDGGTPTDDGNGSTDGDGSTDPEDGTGDGAGEDGGGSEDENAANGTEAGSDDEETDDGAGEDDSEDGSDTEEGDADGDSTDAGDTDDDATDEEETDGEADTDSAETLVVRFEPYGTGGGIGAQDAGNGSAPSIEDLKSHANSSKEPFRDRFGPDDGIGADSADEGEQNVTIKREFWIANAALVEVDTDRVSEAELLDTRGVERVHENIEVDIDSAASVETGAAGSPSPAAESGVTADDRSFTFGLEMINTPTAWEREEFDGTEPGAGATVAVLDTGIDDDHEDLAVDEWAEFNLLGDEVQGSEPNDENGHGTHVAGTVGGAADPAGGGDTYGVAPGASLYGVKVLDDDGAGTLAQVLAGMEWATERDEVDVLQMSLGTEGTVDEFIEPVRNAKSEGKTVVASVGNDGEGSSSSPGNVFDSFSVGAVDEDEAVAFFSGSQTLTNDDWDDPPEDWDDEYDVPTVVGPGVSVESAATGTGDGTTLSSGTSMSAPHAAGTVALIVSATDGIARESTIREAITETARQPDGESSDSDRFGDNGLIDADAAIEEALDSLDDPVVSGTVTDSDSDSDGDPIEGATVSSDAEGVESVETDENGEYELTVPAETQELTVEAFGFNSETREITPELGEERTENFELSSTVDARIVADAPSRFEASSDENNNPESYPIEFDVANLKEYTIRVDGADTEAFDEEFDDGSTVEITVGEDTETIDLSEADPEPASFTELDRTTDSDDETDVFNVDIAPDADLELSRTAFDHDFDSGDDPTVTLDTRRTTIQPDTVSVGTRNLRDLARFVDDGSTVDVNKNTDVSVDNDDPTAVDLDRSLTLTGQHTITASDGTDSETDLQDPIGISITSDGVTIDGPTIEGGTGIELTTGIDIKDVGIGTSDIDADSGSVVSLDNIAVDNAETGLRIDNAAGIGGETIDITATGTGLSVTDSDDVTLSDITITDATTGVELDGETEGAEIGVTIGSGADVDPAVSFGNVEADENEVSVTFEGAVRTEPVTVGGKNATVGEGEEPEDDDNNQIRPKNEDEEELTPLDVFLELDKIEGEENQRIDLTVPYTEAEERRFDETSLALYRFDDEANEWEGAPLETLLDPDARTLSVTVDSFSTFGVYGEEQAFYDVSNLDVTQEEAHHNRELEASADIENIGGDDAENERTAELRLGSDIEGDASDDYEVVASKDIVQLDTGDGSIEITLSGDVPEDVSLGADQDVGIVAVGPNGDEGVAKEDIDVVDRALSGTVTAEDTDDPIEGATVTIEAIDNGFEETETTDADGVYTVEGLDDGDYTVTADADSFGSASATVTADRFEVTTEDFELDPNPGSIEGTVTDSDTDDTIEGATISVGGDSTTTGPDGQYSIDGVARGDRTVTATASGYADGTQTVSVESDETTTANFDLDPVPIFTITEIDVPSSVRQGETLSVGATVQNDGAGAGEAAVELDALGGTTDETVALDPGEETTVTLSRSVSTGTDTGTYDATVSTPDDSRTEPFEVRERRTSSGGGSNSGGGGGGGGPTGPLPEDLRLKGFPSPSVPATATTGEEITISFGLRNRGTTVTDPVLVLANGEEIGRHDRFIGFGAEVDIEVRHTFLEPGDYEIRIDATGLRESDAVLGTIAVTGDPIAADPGTPAEAADPEAPTPTPDADPTPPADPPGQPGFGALLSVVALLVASLLAWRLSGQDGHE